MVIPGDVKLVRRYYVACRTVALTVMFSWRIFLFLGRIAIDPSSTTRSLCCSKTSCFCFRYYFILTPEHPHLNALPFRREPEGIGLGSLGFSEWARILNLLTPDVVKRVVSVIVTG